MVAALDEYHPGQLSTLFMVRIGRVLLPCSSVALFTACMPQQTDGSQHTHTVCTCTVYGRGIA